MLCVLVRVEVSRHVQLDGGAERLPGDVAQAPDARSLPRLDHLLDFAALLDAADGLLTVGGFASVDLLGADADLLVGKLAHGVQIDGNNGTHGSWSFRCGSPGR